MDAYVTTVASFPASEAEPTTTKGTEDSGVSEDAFLVGKNERT